MQPYIVEYLDPVFNKLSAIAKFHIGSQVINYGNFLKSPRWDKNQKVFFIDSHQLHHIINPLEWQLGTVQLVPKIYLIRIK